MRKATISRPLEEGAETAAPSGERPRSSALTKLFFWLALLLLIAGAIAYRGIYTRVRAAAQVKVETQDLAVPSVSFARPKLGAPQQEIILPGNVQAFIEAPDLCPHHRLFEALVRGHRRAR